MKKTLSLVAPILFSALLSSSAAAQPNPACPPDTLCPDWVARYDGSALYDHAFDIAVSPDGTRVFVTGASTSTAGGQDVTTVAYNAITGQQLWVARYDGAGHATDFGAAIAASADGTKVYVTGLSTASSGLTDIITIAYNAASGAEAWATHFATPQANQGSALALSRDGQRLYVTGWSALALAPTLGVPNYDFGTIAYDTSNGAQVWTARYNGPADFWDIPYAMTVGTIPQPGGGSREQVFVTGRSNVASNANAAADYTTVAYDGLTGSELWVSAYDGPGHDRDLAYGVGVVANGSAVVVTGESVGAGTNSDYATVAYDAVTGAQNWVTRYERTDLDLSLGLTVSPAGDRVAVTGFSVNPVGGIGFAPLRDIATIVYNATTGAEVWATRHAETDGAAAARLVFSADGRRLYVAGLENGNVVAVGGGPAGGQVGHAPALTLAYDALSGTEVWATHYSGPAGDEGNSCVAISPDGRHVFAAGGGQSQGADFATLSFTTGAALPAATWTVAQGSAGACNAADRNCGTISAAITAASAGDTIRVGPGTYTEAITVTKTLTLLGAQAGVDARTRAVPLAEETVIDAPPGSVKLYADSIVFDGFIVQGLRFYGIETSQATSGYQILNNIVQQNGVGVAVASSGAIQTIVLHNFIHDNNRPGVTDANGLCVCHGNDVVIRENRFANNPNASIVLVGQPDMDDGVVIERNDSSGDGPIAMFYSQNVTITDNTLRNLTGHGIYVGGNVDSTTIQGNDILDAATLYAAIRFDDWFAIQTPPPATPTPPSKRFQIISNNIVGGAYGISLGRTGTTTYAGPLVMEFNRISGHTTAGISDNEPAATVPAPDNWFGCNAGPGNAGCDVVSGMFANTVAAAPVMVIDIAAAPTALRQYQTSSVTTTMLKNSAGTDVSALGRVPDRIPLVFGATKGSINPASTTLSAGSRGATFTATDGGAGAATATVDNQTVSVAIQITAVADLVVTKTHTGTFRQGQTGATYTLTVSNIGTGDTTGTVSVIDALPSSLTATSMTGTGWSCNVVTLTCTRSDVFAGASVYPPITLTVNVGSSAPSSVINTASVSGGGEFITSNNTASDPTAITGQPPSLTFLDPSSVCQGGPQFEITIGGTSFVNGSIVQIDGSDRPTTVLSATRVTATIGEADLAAAATRSIRVVNPDGGTSAGLPLTVTADTTAPVVSAPAALTLMQSTCPAPGAGAATGATSTALAAFLAGASAVESCSATATPLATLANGNPITNATKFLAGTTAVTFRYTDNAGNVGSAVSSVTVRLSGDLNADDRVDATDLVMLANHLVHNLTAPLDAADVNADRDVNVVDLVVMANYLVGNIDCLSP